MNIEELIKHLKPHRASGYENWTHGFWAICGACDAKGIKRKQSFALAEMFSQLCQDEYDEDNAYKWMCDNYDRRREQGYGFKFLLDCVKEDDPEYYKTLFKKKVQTLTYAEQKKVFEETDCKILYPPMIIHRNKSGNLEMLTCNKAKETYGHIKCLVECKDRKGNEWIEEKRFIDMWLNDPSMKIYDKYDFVPPPEKPDDDIYNTWCPFSILKEAYNPEDKEYSEGILNRFMEYGTNLLGQKVFEFTLAYFANRLQRPAIKNNVCIIIYGVEGDGKNRLLDIFKNIFGLKYFQELESGKQLFEKHSLFEAEKLFILVNEAKGKDNCENSDILKARITTKTITINPKNITPFTINNYCDYLMTTNNYNAVKVDDDSRRYLFCESSGCYRRNVEFFNSLSEDIVENNKALRVIAEYLMNFDVKKVVPSGNFQNHIPQDKDDIMNTIKQYNKDKILLFLEECKALRHNGYFTSDTVFKEWNTWTENNKVKNDYCKITFTTRLGILIKKQRLDFITKATDGSKRGYNIDYKKMKAWLKIDFVDCDVDDHED